MVPGLFVVWTDIERPSTCKNIPFKYSKGIRYLPVNTQSQGAIYLESGLLIGLVVVVSALLMYSFFYTIKKGYSKKWDEEDS